MADDFLNAMTGTGGNDSVYMNLAAAWTSDFNTSENEPLAKKTRTAEPGFDTSDDEPLSRKADLQSVDVSSGDCWQPSSDTNEEALPLATIAKKKHRRKTTTERDTERTKLASLREASSLAKEKKSHLSRLRNLLLANGFQQIEVAPDGNCFFESCSKHFDSMTSLDVRRYLCDYLEDEYSTFIGFMAAHDSSDENESYLRYFHKVNQLRSPGFWSNDAADFLPLALANWTKRTVKIFSSDHNKPVVEIPPLVSSGLSTNNTAISLAYLALKDAPHYDACIPMDRRPASTVAPNQADAESEQPPQQDQYSPQELNASPHLGATQSDDQTASCSPHPSSFQPSDRVQTPRKEVNASPRMGATQSDDQTASCSPPPSSSQPSNRVQTPRKEGTFRTPPKTKPLTRKTEPRPETWKKNVRKNLRLHGKEYTSEKGKVVPKKVLKPIDCSKCKHKCSRITEEQRQDIFNTYYALNTYSSQKNVVCSNVQEKKTKTVLNEDDVAIEKRRNVSREYSLTINGKKERVCKQFFLSTLGISRSFVDHALKNCKYGVFIGESRRGKHQPHNKTTVQAVETVKRHIESFPVVESHYTRKDTKRKYLPANLTITKMYELYKDQCQDEGIQPVSSKKYRNIFNTKYNLSFHVPKKDQCATCTAAAIKKAQNTLTEADEESLQQHLSRRETARQHKSADKEASKRDPSLHVVTVDMQAVLQCPCGLVSQLYYKRKLCVYNFTVYSLSNGRATCYTWDETEGKRGSCEIASCLFKYISSLPAHVQHVVIYSDCCGGQNRNQYVTAALLFAVNMLPNTKTVTQKYLESGHTQMECDSMHAAISRAKKNTPIYVPSEWDIVFRLARREYRYNVVPIGHESFYDFKRLASAYIRNTKTDTTGHRVNWLNIRLIQVSKGVDDIMLFKTNLDDENMKALKLVGSSRRGRQELPTVLHQLYHQKLPVSEAKKKDLLSLCTNGVIPKSHHHFYHDIPAASSADDKLPEPDVKDSQSDTD